MKSLIGAAVLLVVVVVMCDGRPGEEVIIIRSESEHGGDGTYRFLWENSDGTQFEESGYLKPNGEEEPIQVAQGSYQYFSPEGELIRVEYIADENGFQPTGDHLPTPPTNPHSKRSAAAAPKAAPAKKATS